jgi:hypothetical protein
MSQVQVQVQFQSYILKALNNRYNLTEQATTDIFERNDTTVEWSHNCMVTQDWDELNEFIYTNELNMPDEKKPAYFEPHSKWSCIVLPKIKIRWTTRVKQIKLGSTLFNILEGKWDSSGAFLPNVASADELAVKIYPYHASSPALKDTNSNEAIVLIPFKNYTSTQKIPDDTLPKLCIANENLECVYSTVYVNVSFNRQGLYINRKYREKTEYVNQSDLPTDYTIIEPGSIEIRLNDDKIKIQL